MKRLLLSPRSQRRGERCRICTFVGRAEGVRWLAVAGAAILLVVSAADGALAGRASIERASVSTPAVVLQRLVTAARASSALAMWRLLDLRSRERLGPFPRFRQGAAPALTRQLAGLGRYRAILSEQITPAFSVAALADEGRAYAASLRREHGSWHITISGAVRLRAICPDPGDTVVDRTQLAAEITANAPILEGGMWLDGLAFSTKAGGPHSRRITMWDEAPQPLKRGLHVVVAFASTATDATALAWTFSVS